MWKHLERAISLYHGTIFSMAAFTRPLACPMFVIPPAIDPLFSTRIVRFPKVSDWKHWPGWASIPERLLLLQVSRFDRFKDPLGVIEAYRLLQALLSGTSVGVGRSARGR